MNLGGGKMYISSSSFKKKKTPALRRGNFKDQILPRRYRSGSRVRREGCSFHRAQPGKGAAWPCPHLSPARASLRSSQPGPLGAMPTRSRLVTWHKTVDRRTAGQCFYGDFILKFSLHKKCWNNMQYFPLKCKRKGGLHFFPSFVLNIL